MRRVNNKRAFTGLLTVLLMVILIGFVLISSFLFNVDNLGSNEKYVGKIQYDTFAAGNDYQFDMLYYDGISKMFAKEVLSDIAISGGVDGSCGRYGFYNTWIGKDTNCTPVNDNYDLAFMSPILKTYTDVKGDNDFYCSIKNNDTTISVFSLNDVEYVRGDVTVKNRIAFDAYYNYNLGIYSDSYSAAKKIVGECVGYTDYEACVNSKFLHLRSINNIDFRSDCLKEEEWVFNKFVENFVDCFDSIDNDCVCTFDMDANKDLVKSGKYEITVNKESIFMTLEGREDLVYKFDFPVKFGEDFTNVGNAKQIVYTISYDFKGKVNRITLDTGSGDRRVSSIGVYRNYLYEYEDNNWVAFIRSFSPKQECSVFNRYVDLCVNNKNSEVEDIRFSLYIKDIIPPPDVNNVKVENVDNAEGRVRLTFDKFIGIEEPPVMDVLKYHFYVMTSDREFTHFDVSTTEANVTFDASEISVLPEVYFDVKDNEKYYFGILAEDIFGNKLDVIKFYDGVSFDNLAPGNIAINEGGIISENSSYRLITSDEQGELRISWPKSMINIDGSKNKDDVVGYMIINAEKIYDPDEILVIGDLNSVVSSCQESVICTYVEGQETFSTTISLLKGENYVAVIPVDEAGNYPIEDSASGASSFLKGGRYNLDTYASSGFASIMKAEGGWVSDPDDKGGETYTGITTYYNPDWAGWEIVRGTRVELFGAKDPYKLTRKEVKRLNQELRANKELDSYVNEYYQEFQRKKGILKIASPPVQELAFNFILNTPKGAMISLNKATGSTLSSTGGTVSDALALELNKIDVSDITQAEAFGNRFAIAMYDYYTTRQEKFRRGWYNRVKHGVNLYLEQVGSDKSITIEESGPVMS